MKILITTRPHKLKVICGILLALVFSQFLVACGSDEPAQIVQARQHWLQRIDQAAAAWKATGIKSYRIEVSYHNTPWQWGELYTLTVKNGQPVETSFQFIARECCKDENPKPSPGSKPT